LSYGDELGVATPLPAITEKNPAKRWAASCASATRTMRLTRDAYSVECEDLDGAANEAMRDAARG